MPNPFLLALWISSLCFHVRYLGTGLGPALLLPQPLRVGMLHRSRIQSSVVGDKLQGLKIAETKGPCGLIRGLGITKPAF